MEFHTLRSLYEKWDSKHNEMSDNIKNLKKKMENTENYELAGQYEWEINHLAVQANVISKILADVGLMIYVDENK